VTESVAGAGADAPESRARSAAVRGAVMGATVAVIAVVAGVWLYHRVLLRDERERVARVAGPTSEALRAAVERRVALLEGLRSFAESRPSRAALDAEFSVFAQGLTASASGVRALQFVEGGRIVATWPLLGNEAALGYDLLADPRPTIPADVRRALTTREVVVTGPIALVQGGEGLLVRERIAPRAGFPQLAAIILDVPALVREAGIPDPRTGLRLEVRDRGGDWFGGDAQGLAVAPETLVVRVPDGDWTLLAAPLEGWNAAIAAPMRLAVVNGTAIIVALGLLGYLLGARQDRLAKEAQDWRAQLSVALRAARMGTWDWDIVGDQLRWSDSAAAVLGRAPGELDGPGARFMATVHPNDREFVFGCLQEVLASNRLDYLLEYRVVLPDGGDRWVFAMGEFDRGPDGRATRARGVISDATDRRELEARVRHTERLETMGTLAGGVAHDFNNLLGAVMSFSELALEQLEDAGDDPRIASARDDIREVLGVVTRAAGLTGQILAFSRKTSTVDPQRLDAAEAVLDLRPMLERILGKPGALDMEREPGAHPVWMDHGQFTQVVLNLVTNARDAVADGGTVTISVGRVGERLAAAERIPADWVRLEVEDTGRGMDEATLAHIFEPYFTTKESTRGTGLGLAVLMGAVKRAGGEVRVRSAPGKGSTFRVFLPPFDPSAPRPAA
jgi:signal transduction histidine kinase